MSAAPSSVRPDRIAVVTGAASGIGRATAIRLARARARAVVAIDISDKLEQAAEDIRAEGAEVMPIRLDVTDLHALARAFADIHQRFGRVDILANVAGGGGDYKREFHESTAEGWHSAINLSLVSAMACARHVVNGMRERRYGKICNVSSTTWFAPSPTMVDYAAAKAGLLGFTRSLAMAVAPLSINVNMVTPGPVDTPGMSSIPPELKARNMITPIGRMGQPEDLANAINFLVSDEASFITGQNLLVSGGKGLN